RPEDPSLEHLRSATRGDHALYALDVRGLADARTRHRGVPNLDERDCLEFPAAVLGGDRVSAARTLREEPSLPARRARPEAHLDGHRARAQGVLHEPLRAALLAEGEEHVWRGLHLSRRGFLR